MAVFAVVDEAGFERRLDARHDRLVDIALALFATFDLGLEVDQLLAVDDGQAAFFGLRRVDQHAFHLHSFDAARARAALTGAGPTEVGSSQRCTRNERTRRNRPGLTASGRAQATAGSVSVGARGQRASAWKASLPSLHAGRSASSGTWAKCLFLRSSATGNLVADSFLFALPSRHEAAASHGNAACRGDATLHHRVWPEQDPTAPSGPRASAGMATAKL